MALFGMRNEILAKMIPNGTIRRFASALLASAVAIGSTPAKAQEPQLNVIRDAEIEQLMRDYTAPIFKAAGINGSNMKIVLLGDRSFNAFVVDGKRIFINIGALMESEHPNEVIGVLAHESGHIAGGHLARRGAELEKAKYIAIIGTILGAGAAVGAGTARQVGGNPMGAIMIGPSLAQRTLLSYQRGEETAADRAAVTFLDKTHQSASGLLATFKRLDNQQMFSRSQVDPYLQNHPMFPERIAAVEHVAEESPYFAVKDPPALQTRHDLMRAKLYGFVGRADEISRRYPPSDTSLGARYARAISAYRFGRIDEAQAQIDNLIAQQPANAYFWELKGQSLLENGRAAQAIAPLRKAVALSGGSPLIRILLGHALLSADSQRYADEALKELTQATQRDTDSVEGFRFLSQAYANKGNEPMAALVTAQVYANAGDYVGAAQIARRAKAGLPPNSPGWLKADDIINLKPKQ